MTNDEQANDTNEFTNEIERLKAEAVEVMQSRASEQRWACCESDVSIYVRGVRTMALVIEVAVKQIALRHPIDLETVLGALEDVVVFSSPTHPGFFELTDQEQHAVLARMNEPLTWQAAMAVVEGAN